MVSSRRISRACSKPSIRGRGAQVASAQAGAPQIIMRAGFGEAALANMSKGKAYLIVLRKCRSVASRDDMFAIFLQEVVTKVAHLNVKAFVLSGSRAQADALPFVMGARFGEAALASVREGRAHFLVLGEFCQVASEDQMFAFFLPEIVI